MTECWSEGELRAYLDRELPAEQLERLAAHVAECAECGRVLAGLEARAAWVGGLMQELPGTVAAHRERHGWRWVAAAAALAAGLAVAALLAPRHVAPPRVASKAPGSPAVATPVEPPFTAAAVAPVPVEPRETPVRRTVPRKRAPRPAPRDEGFVSLSDEPFETGVVMRVALGPAEVPADVVFGSDGRARAIRLVGYK